MQVGIDGMYMAGYGKITKITSEYLFSHQRKYTPEEKQKLIAFMKSCKPFAYSSGNIVDCVTGKETNVPETLIKDKDGVFYWSSSHLYYMEKYDFALDEGFIRYVMEKS